MNSHSLNCERKKERIYIHTHILVQATGCFFFFLVSTSNWMLVEQAFYIVRPNIACCDCCHACLTFTPSDNFIFRKSKLTGNNISILVTDICFLNDRFYLSQFGSRSFKMSVMTHNRVNRLHLVTINTKP